MDIVRDESVKKKKRQKQVLLTVGAVAAVVAVTIAVSRLPTAVPHVDFGTVWPDAVKRGPMIVQVHGLGTLVPIPENIRLIAAETDVRVDRILVLPGTPVKADTIIMELSNPTVEQQAIDADLDEKSAEANYHNAKAKMDSDLGTVRAEMATVEAEYQNAKRDATANRELAKIGVLSDATLKASLAKEKELATRYKIAQERVDENTKAIETQMEVQKVL